MGKILLYFLSAAVILAAGLLTGFAPDVFSLGITAGMTVLVVAGIGVGVAPLIRYAGAFRKATGRIAALENTQTESRWLAVQQIDALFDQSFLDGLFAQYTARVQQQRKRGVVLSSPDETINEEVLGLKTWQGVMQQLPGTLTGIGLLGTFIGLLTGINGIEFSSVDAAITSIQLLLDGIRLAFYTSVAGVVLSILFNILYKMVWNVTRRELGMFYSEFERQVIPSEAEQTRYRRKREMQQVLEKLDRLPRNNGYSLSNQSTHSKTSAGNEQILMPQILSGLQNEEFTFYLQPRYDLNNHQVVGAEALVRWQHKKLGLVSPAVFIPTLESNGYITKLDQYMWEQVCKTIRRWADAGMRPVPISVNISKTDILAMDVARFFVDTLRKYRLPPRCLELDIAENAYLQAKNVTLETERALQQAGFRVAIDGFTGDYVALTNAVPTINADALKLDLRFMAEKKADIAAALDQAGKLKLTVIAEGIETMEQLTLLRRKGCTQGQGYQLAKPVAIEEFEKTLARRVPTQKGKMTEKQNEKTTETGK